MVPRVALVAAVLLCALPAASPAQVQADVRARAELWPQSDRGFQHRLGGDVAVTVPLGPIQLEGWVGLELWLQHDAKIPGSPLNAEAAHVLERRHGLNATVRLVGSCRAGGWVGRRAVIWLGRELLWPEGAAQQGKDPSIGYHDELRPIARCGQVELRGPAVRWHTVTLPSSSWELQARTALGTSWRASIDAAYGGSRDDQVDVGVLRRVGVLWMGARVGYIAEPGWDRRPLFRAAIALEVGQ